MGAGPAGLIPAVRLPSPRTWGAFREASCHARRPRPERAAAGPRPGLVRCRPGLPPQPVASTSCGPAVLVAGAWGPGTSAPETRPCSLHPGRPACCPEPPCRPPRGAAALRPAPGTPPPCSPRPHVCSFPVARAPGLCSHWSCVSRPVGLRTSRSMSFCVLPGAWGRRGRVVVRLTIPRVTRESCGCHPSGPSTLQRQETVGPRHTTMGRTEP